MRIPRVYIDQPRLGDDETLTLDTELSHRLKRVLRLKTGYLLSLFNGRGNEYAAELIDYVGKHAHIRLKQAINNATESPLPTHLLLGISRGERMDYALQKSVELGVNRIQPLLTRYCEVKLSRNRLDKRMQHWQGIIISACEQSGRNALPILDAPISLAACLQQNLAQKQPCLVFHPESTQCLRDLDKASTEKGIALLIGPEGGLSEQEVEQAVQHKFTAMRLGGRVLRTETAPVAALAALQTLFGDF